MPWRHGDWGGPEHTAVVPVLAGEDGAIRIDLSFPHEGRWRVKNVDFYHGDERIEGVLPSEHFTSAWMSEAEESRNNLQSNGGFELFAFPSKMNYVCKKQCRMCTIILSYDQNNALARKKLAELLKTGLFESKEASSTTPVSASDAETAALRQEVEEFLYGSKLMAAKAFGNKL